VSTPPAPAADPTPQAPAAKSPRPSPVYPNVEAFVVGFLAPTIARKLVAGGRGLTWCPQWWMHAEAIARLMALWEAWEALRLDGGTAMGTWWRDHCGPQLGVLRIQGIHPDHGPDDTGAPSLGTTRSGPDSPVRAGGLRTVDACSGIGLDRGAST